MKNYFFEKNTTKKNHKNQVDILLIQLNKKISEEILKNHLTILFK